jgi:hypothetical protein
MRDWKNRVLMLVCWGLILGINISTPFHRGKKTWSGLTILFNKVFMLNVDLHSREISACPKNSTIS